MRFATRGEICFRACKIFSTIFSIATEKREKGKLVGNMGCFYIDLCQVHH